ncbi:MAG: CapA family protein [Nitrososphaeria archaeon]
MRLIFAGDITYSEDPAGRVDPRVVEVLREGYAIANLEGPITNYGPSARKSVVISQPPEFARSLAGIGIRAVSLANNHVMDHLERGLEDTIKALDSVGIAHFGAGADLAEAAAPLRLEGVSIFGLATTLPPGSEAGPGHPGVSPVRVRCSYVLDPDEAREQPGIHPRAECSPDRRDVERVVRAVRRERSRGRRVILMIHWGLASQRSPLPYQRELARRLAAAGADLIVGTHPHGVVGWEMVEGARVFYGIGALILKPSFEYPLPRTMQSLMLRVDVSEGGLSAEPVPLVLEEGYPRMQIDGEEAPGDSPGTSAGAPGHTRSWGGASPS